MGGGAVKRLTKGKRRRWSLYRRLTKPVGLEAEIVP